MTTYTYLTTSELPAWKGQWSDGDGNPVDLSAATFEVKLVSRNGAIALTKTSGITGTVDGTVTVQWAVGELNIAPGKYRLYLVARTGSLDRAFDPGNPPVIAVLQAP